MWTVSPVFLNCFFSPLALSEWSSSLNQGDDLVKETTHSLTGATSSSTESKLELRLTIQSVMGRLEMVFESRTVLMVFVFLKCMVRFLGVGGRGVQDRR